MAYHHRFCVSLRKAVLLFSFLSFLSLLLSLTFFSEGTVHINEDTHRQQKIYDESRHGYRESRGVDTIYRDIEGRDNNVQNTDGVLARDADVTKQWKPVQTRHGYIEITDINTRYKKTKGTETRDKEIKTRDKGTKVTKTRDKETKVTDTRDKETKRIDTSGQTIIHNSENGVYDKRYTGAEYTHNNIKAHDLTKSTGDNNSKDNNAYANNNAHQNNKERSENHSDSHDNTDEQNNSDAYDNRYEQNNSFGNNRKNNNNTAYHEASHQYFTEINRTGHERPRSDSIETLARSESSVLGKDIYEKNNGELGSANDKFGSRDENSGSLGEKSGLRDENTGSIPHIIHQAWDDENVPSQVAPWLSSWLEVHPRWQHWFWTESHSRRLIGSSKYGQLLDLYDQYPYKINRADVRRYFIMYEYGGVYADLDVEALRPLDDVLSKYSCVIAEEPLVHQVLLYNDTTLDVPFSASVSPSLRYSSSSSSSSSNSSGYSSLSSSSSSTSSSSISSSSAPRHTSSTTSVPNFAMPAFMACRPGHPFFKLLISSLSSSISLAWSLPWNDNILHSTGPYYVQRMLRQYQESLRGEPKNSSNVSTLSSSASSLPSSSSPPSPSSGSSSSSEESYGRVLGVKEEDQVFIAPWQWFMPDYDTSNLSAFLAACKDYSNKADKDNERNNNNNGNKTSNKRFRSKKDLNSRNSNIDNLQKGNTHFNSRKAAVCASLLNTSSSNENSRNKSSYTRHYWLHTWSSKFTSNSTVHVHKINKNIQIAKVT